MTKIDTLEYTEKANSKFYKVIAGGKTYRAFEDSIAFTQFKEGKFKEGDEVDLKYTDNPDKNDPKIIYHNLDSLEQLSGTGKEAPPNPKTISTSFAGNKELEPEAPKETKSSSDSDGDMSVEEYRKYQKQMMHDCLEDSEIEGYDLPADKKVDVAIAFFEKRNSPRFYAKKEEK